MLGTTSGHEQTSLAADDDDATVLAYDLSVCGDDHDAGSRR